MSEQRLYQLKEALETRGWYVTDLNDDVSWKALIKVNDDGYLWWKVHRKTKIITLHFFLTTHLGRKTLDLRNIVHVSSSCSDEILFFSKINSEEWQQDVLNFIYSLDNCS